MKKKSLLRLITIAVLMLAVMLAMFPGKALAENSGGDKEEQGMHAGKHITVQDDGTYVIDLDAYATGEATFDTVTVPADIILVLDVSGSMEDDMTDASYEYTARESQAYTYSNYGNNEYYYKDSSGNYHQVFRYNNNGRYYLRYSRGYNTYTYLTGTSTQNSRPNDAPNNQNTTIWTGVLYEMETTPAVTKMDALKTAVNTFVDEVAAKNKEASDAGATTSELSRIAIVKFAGSNSNDIGNDTYQSGWNTYNYSQIVKDLGVVTQDNAQETWKATVNAFNPGGATRADFGMAHAKTIINNHADDHNYTDPEAADYRSRVVVMFTDGLPTSGTQFEASVANAAVKNSKDLKDKDVTVYSVAVHPDAKPEEDPGTQNFNQYLHAVSSNYPDATSYTDRGTRGQGNYYFAASSADELEKIFKEIGKSSGSTTTEVGSEAIMKDIVASSFTLPEGADEDDISIKIVRWNSTSHDWGTGDGYVFTPEQWATACTTYGATEAENVSASINGANVDITGFDYATHFKATSDEQDNDQYDVVGGVNKNTAKIVVSFPIQAKTSAITGSSVATNGADSGIYLNGEATEPLIRFDVPEVTFTPVTYVVDYVTSDTSTDTKASTIKLDYSKVLSNVQMLDDPSDDVLIGKDAVDFEYTIYKGKYGTISFGDDETDVQRRYVRYAPTTMNWDGYDRIFVKGASADADSDLNVWAMLCVLPANSVFYEDTYITQTKTAHYNDQDVTIEYTGIAYDENWSTVGTEGTNQTQHADATMGWIDGLADDTTYANDMAHTANTAKAKATFTVTGTGIDIYSRTNGSTGTVLVSVKSAADENESGKKVAKSKIIDTKAAAGDFFAIPVCTFTDLPYGKYTTTITVTAGGQKEGRMTFYLDGIRVYNPIQPLEGEENVQTMYGKENLGAVFTEVRSLLGSSDAQAAKGLYLDEKTTDTIVTDVEAIQEAAKELAEAQEARDKYVEETITPAKNAVSAEEYALSSAENALDAAQKAYEAVKDTATQEELDKLQAKIDEAQTAYDAAKAHYDANIGRLNDDLDAAIAGKAGLDAAVDAAIKHYDDVNDGVTVGYSEATIADYEKEGPKSEVYLDKNQQVAINVESGKYYYIGLKSFKGKEVTAQINGKEVTLSHTTDLYYEATPKSGTVITIKNVGDEILSITKLRTTGEGNTTSGTKLTSTEETLNYVRNLEKEDKEVTSYDGDVLTEEEVNAAADTTTEETETLLDESDIVIENANVDSESEVVEETETTEAAPSEWSRFLSSFFGFFRH